MLKFLSSEPVAARIRQLAREMGDTALKQAFELPIPWIDAWGSSRPITTAVRARTLASFPEAIQPIPRPAFRHRPGATPRGPSSNRQARVTS